MGVSIEGVVSQNITLVFDSLDPRIVDINRLKSVVDSPVQPVLMDTPGMIVAVFPQIPVIVQIGDQRIRVTVSKPVEEIGSVSLWEIATNCNDLVRNLNLTAYGFNYDVIVGLDAGNAHSLAVTLCVSDIEQMEKKLGAHLRSFVPRLVFQKDRTQYDLAIEPLEDQRLKVHMNVHYEFPSVVLPGQSRLAAAFRDEYDYLGSCLPALLEGGKW